MKLTVQAPTRIDLAGGTLDVHPLYVFEGGALTVNAAIDLYSRVEIESRDDGRIRLMAQDFDASLEVASLQDLDPDEAGQALDLIVRILRFYRPSGGLTIRTSSQVPAGSGLGGSSSLLVALSAALVQWENRPISKLEMIDWGAEIEAESIGIPTGKQDYYPPAFGGICALRLGMTGVRREPIELSAAFSARLQESLVLGYSGASRFSGTNNWEVLKGYVEKRRETIQSVRRLKSTAERTYKALKKEDLEELARCLDEEWSNRRGLAPGVSTPEVEGIFADARAAGAWSLKLCGAGGGGCFCALVPAQKRDEVVRAIQARKGRVLDCRLEAAGVRVDRYEA